MDVNQALSAKQRGTIPIAAMNAGLTAAQMQDFIAMLESKVGKKEAENASEILGQVSSARAK